MIKNEKQYLFDDLHVVIFKIIGDLDKVLNDFGIQAVIYKKLNKENIYSLIKSVSYLIIK